MFACKQKHEKDEQSKVNFISVIRQSRRKQLKSRTKHKQDRKVQSEAILGVFTIKKDKNGVLGCTL